MTQLDDVQAYINDELPRRVVLLNSTFVAYDGDPNLAGAPAILQGSPLGTLYHEETNNIFWIKQYLARASDWIIFGSDSSPFSKADAGTMTIQINYNDATAVDPGSGITFVNQAQIDAYLSTSGATAFKHIETLWGALPVEIPNTTTINLEIATGVQLPVAHAAGALGCFPLSGKKIDGIINLKGDPGAVTSYFGSPGVPLVIDDYDDGGAAADEYGWIRYIGSPFTGLDVSGLTAQYLDGSTYRSYIIAWNTDDTIYLEDMNGNEMDKQGSWIGVPSTILYNSLDDSTVEGDYILHLDNTGVGKLNIYDLTVEPRGITPLGSVGIGKGNYVIRDLCIDHLEAPIERRADGFIIGGVGLTSYGASGTDLVSLERVGRRSTGNFDSAIEAYNIKYFAIHLSAFSKNKVSIEDAKFVGLSRSSFGGMGSSAVSIRRCQELRIMFSGTSKGSDYCNFHGDTYGLILEDVAVERLTAFVGGTESCLRIEGNFRMLDAQAFDLWKQVAANPTEYGVLFPKAPRGYCELFIYIDPFSGVDDAWISGTLGDIGIHSNIFADPDEIVSYEDIDQYLGVTNGNVSIGQGA